MKVPEYTIKKSRRAKYLRISVYPNKSVVVTTPISIPTENADEYVAKNIKWIQDKLTILNKRGLVERIPSSKRDYKKYKAGALSLAAQKLNFFNEIYGYKFNTVSIRNQKTRWGSCSRKGSLSFNYKIVLIPNDLTDYIIVHELCHLKELNHSKNFWGLVTKAIPNYKELRKRIKNIV